MSLKALLFGLLVSCLVNTANGALTLQLTPATPSAAPGAVLTFQGILTNTSATDKVYLNDIQAVLTGDSATNVTLKSNAYFSNVPGILLPGETYNGPLFQMRLSGSAPAANYSGSVTFIGGTDIFASSPLATGSLTLLATPVEQWRYNTFGTDASTMAASDLGDWDGDGVPNLLEYALGMNALAADAASLPQAFPLNGYPAITYLPAASDVTYTVQSSTDLIHWDSTKIQAVAGGNPNPPGSVTLRFNTPVANTARVFLRVWVSR